MSTSRPPTRASTVISRAASRATSRTAYRTVDSDESQWIVAVVEGKSREIGLVALERDSPRVVATQYPDTPTFIRTLHLLATRPPVTLVVPSTALARETKGIRSGGQAPLNEASLLVRTIRDAWPDAAIHGTDRSTWEEQRGYEHVCALIVRDNERIATINAIKHKYYALAAVAGLFSHLAQANALVFPPKSVRFKYGPPEGTCLLDRETVQHLELTSNAVQRLSKQHLLGLLNRCVTPMGVRLLRANILAPLAEPEAINDRLDAVEELIGSDDRFQTVKKALLPLKGIDLDQLVNQIVLARSSRSPADLPKESEAKIARLLSLRQVLHALPTVRTLLAYTESSLLQSIHTILSDERLEDIVSWIDDTINDEAVSSGQKGTFATRHARLYAVKADRRLLLEVARETYKENVDDIFTLADNLKKEHDLDFGLRYAQTGFVFEIMSSELEHKDLPAVFINLSNSGKKTTFSTLDLKKKNAHLLDSTHEIFLQSNALLDEIFEEIRGVIACLYRTVEAVAMLDMLVSLADVAVTNNYVRPEFTKTLAIKSGRHPLVEHFRLADGSFVPNDTYAEDASSFQIITGANMSGKSTLLRQVATLQIMAQIGSYVPAEYASFRIVDGIFSRLSNDDSIEANLSTFALEMTTMAAILSALETYKRPLIIVDELGRGTAPNEGIGIAHAIAEQILRTKAICFFATHFKILTQTLGRYPNVISLQLDAEMDTDATEFSLTFHHRLKDGVTPLKQYGIELAKGARLPPDVVPRSQEIARRLRELSNADKVDEEQKKAVERRKTLRQVRSQMEQLADGKGFTVDELRERLFELREIMQAN